MNPEDRLIAIESKIAEQEDLVESLNQTVYRQQQQIDQLEELLSALVRRMKDSGAESSDEQPGDERPPHY
ncbi:MAG: SlyX family protein [Herbaspirillum sp.]|nr:SlyX family protein [Herbaspirillum sp.]